MESLAQRLQTQDKLNNVGYALAWDTRRSADHMQSVKGVRRNELSIWLIELDCFRRSGRSWELPDGLK
eukprot:scaffold105860_cov20-Prasinocladus_malaysianus.AAC.1